MRALCLLRESPHYRRAAFLDGLRAAGFACVAHLPDPGPADVLVIWNRYSRFDADAKRFEAAGARVVVVENGYLGKSWHGGEWFALALGHHAGAGTWPDGGPRRWESWGVEFAPWRDGPGETLILGQRGIGETGIASPSGWEEATRRKIGGRVRPHPGRDGAAVPLAQDLAGAGCVVAWHSSAALLALLAGVPVWYDFPRWIGARAGRHLSQWGRVESNRSDSDRLAMFGRLAWAQWNLGEIANGTAIRHLLAG